MRKVTNIFGAKTQIHSKDWSCSCYFLNMRWPIERLAFPMFAFVFNESYAFSTSITPHVQIQKLPIYLISWYKQSSFHHKKLLYDSFGVILPSLIYRFLHKHSFVWSTIREVTFHFVFAIYLGKPFMEKFIQRFCLFRWHCIMKIKSIPFENSI